LQWDLTYADKREWLQKLQDEGNDIPALQTKPELYLDLGHDYEAFSILNSSRPNSGMGLSPIPLSEIYSYMRIFEITEMSHRTVFLNRMQILDRTYIKWHHNKDKTNQPSEKV
jgi:hypothetical protein